MKKIGFKKLFLPIFLIAGFLFLQTAVARDFTIQSTAGVPYLKVDGTTGKIGIGTTTPGSVFSIDGISGDYSTANALVSFRNKDTNIAFQMGASSTYGWIRAVSANVTADNVSLILQPSGTNANVGIGTIAPSYKLDVVGTAQFSQPIIVGTPTIAGHATTKSYVDSVLTGGTATGTLANLTVTGTTTLATTAGRVGIGTTAPSYKFEVRDVSPVNTYDITAAFGSSETTGAIDTGGAFGFSFNDGVNRRTAAVIRGLKENGTSGNYAGYLSFLTRANGSNPAEAMRITSAGNVGIGTTTPSGKLTVVDNGSSGTYVLSVHADDQSPYVAGFFNNTYSSTVPVFQYFGYDNGDFSMGSPGNTTTSVSIYTNGYSNPRMTITSTGNVGIGDTSPAAMLTVGNGDLFQVNSSGAITASAGITTTGQLTLSGSSANIALGSNYLSGDGGDEGIFVDSAGSVGIGTTTPVAKLNLYDSSGIVSVLDISTANDTPWGFRILNRTYSTNPVNAFSGYQTNTGEFVMRNMGINTLTLKSGYIGIGTTTPSYGLDVVGTAQFSQPVIVGTPTIAGHATTKSYVDSVLTGGTATGTLANLTVTGTTTLATTGGNVGIGTTTAPTAKLDVAGEIRSSVVGAAALFSAYNPGANYPRGLFKVGNSAADVNTGLAFAPEFTSAGVTKPFVVDVWNNKLTADASARVIGVGIYSTYASIHSLGPSGNSPGLPIIFSTQNYAGTAPGIYISSSSSQNVGIGTTTPGYALTLGSGQIAAPAGLVGTPSYSFTSDSDSGFYSGGSGVVNVALNGANQYRIDDALGIYMVNASKWRLSVDDTSATAPNIIPNRTYTTTGIGSAGANIVSLIANGINGLNVNSSGYVGIATTTPASLFTVASSTGSANFFQVNSVGNIIAGSGGLSQWQSSSTAFTFNTPVNLGNIVTASDLGSHTLYNQPVTSASVVGTNVGPTFSIDSNPVLTIYGESDGNGGAQNLRVGIGDTTPSYTLDVVGTAQFSQPIIVGTPTIAGHATTKSYVDSVLTGGTATGTLSQLVVTGTTTLQGTTILTGLSGVLKTTAGVISGSATTDDLTEGTNQYFTNLRARAALSGTSPISFSTTTGVISLTTVPVGSGGSGATTLTGILKGNGVDAFTAITGVSNYLTKWSDANTIGTSTIYESSGSVGVGTSSPVGKLEVIDTAAGGLRGIVSTQISASNHGAYFSFRKSRGSVGSPATVVSGDDIGSINGWAYDGTNFLNTAAVLFDTSGVISADSVPTRIAFYAGTNSGNLSEKMTITSDGYVGIGTTTPGTPLHVLGSTFPVGLIERTSAETNTVLSSLGVRHTTTGDMADGFGAGFTFQIKDSAGTANPVGAIFGVRNGADNSGRMAFYTYNAGTGSEKMTITSDGYVGIGTTTPAKKLDIVGTTRIQGTGFTASSLDYDLNIVSNTNSTSTYPHLMVANRNQSGNSLSKIGFNVGDGTIIAAFVADLAGYGTGQSYTASGLDSPGAGIQVYNNYPFMIKTNNVERLRVANDGKVGIGTTTPNYTLDVVGTAQFSQPIIVGTPTIAGHATTKSYVDSVLTGGTATGTLANLTVTGTTTLATTAGNVGIGYTTPGSVLPTTFTSANSKIIEARSVSTGDVGLFLRRGSDDAAGLDMWSDNSSGDSYIDNRHNADTSDIRFRTKTAATAVDAMIITGAGKVGIGDTDPDQALEVMSSAAAGTQVTISNTNSGDADPRIGFELADGTNTFTVGVDDSDSDKFKISTTALGTNARLVIDSSGNIGIATSTPAAKLDIAGTADSIQLIVRASTTQSNSNPLVQLRKSDSSVLSSWHSDNAQNLFIGYLNGTNNNISGTGSEGLDNIFIGYRTGNGNTTGTRNTALGSEAFEYNSTGYFNTAMGSFASHYNSTGANNSSFGYFANYQNQTGSNNTAVGAEAGYSNTSGLGNVFLGYRAGYSETGSNKLYIANSSTNPPLIFGDFTGGYVAIGTTTPSYTFHVEGNGYFSQPLLVGTPTIDGHAATKSYVDSVLTGGTATGTLANLIVTGTTTLATTGGNVGIGTTTPTYKLAVQGDTYINGLFNTSGDVNIGNYAYAKRFYDLDDNNWHIDPASASVINLGAIGAITIGTTTPPNDALVPLVVVGTSSFGGNVGIGTTTPAYPLVISSTTGSTAFSVSIAGEGQLAVPGGSGSLPGISFVGDPNTGIYSINGDEISITTGGTRRGLINSTGIIGGNSVTGGPMMISSAGTTSTPAFTFYGDTNTGLSRSGTDFMSFITAGSARMVVNASGYVGIGDTSPSYTLDVSGTGQFTQPLLVGTPTLDGHAATKNYIDPYMVFTKVTGTGSTTAYSAVNGNVGIGDFSGTPANAKLEVKGGVRLNTTEAKPTCDSNQRGTIWHTQGGVLVKDSLEVCVKTGSDTYVWNAIY